MNVIAQGQSEPGTYETKKINSSKKQLSSVYYDPPKPDSPPVSI